MATHDKIGIRVISISVLIPVYKTQDYLPLALKSLADQKHRPQQVVIVDDGPEPAIEEIAQDWTNRLNIVILKHPTNLGTLQARKTAADHCRTQYAIYLDPDDTLHPDALSELAQCASQTQADVICAGIKHFGVDGEVTLLLEPPSDQIVTFDKDEAFRNQFTSATAEFKYAALSTGGGKLIRTETLQAAMRHLGENVPHIVYSDDSILMFLVLAMAQKICQHPGSLYEYRRRTTSATHVVGMERALKYLSDSNWATDRMEDYARSKMKPDGDVMKMLFHNRRYIQTTAITQRLGRTHWTEDELRQMYETFPDALREALYATEINLQLSSLKKRRYRLQDEAAKADKLIRSLKFRNRNLQAELSKANTKADE